MAEGTHTTPELTFPGHNRLALVILPLWKPRPASSGTMCQHPPVKPW